MKKKKTAMEKQQTEANTVLQQINDKQYADAFALQNKPVVKVGINYTIKEKVSTLEWVIE